MINIDPLPCPFCGGEPTVRPADPGIGGNSWGEVCCYNPDCPAQPCVEDGEDTADDRGSDAYKKAAILRWNNRGRV